MALSDRNGVVLERCSFGVTVVMVLWIDWLVAVMLCVFWWDCSDVLYRSSLSGVTVAKLFCDHCTVGVTRLS